MSEPQQHDWSQIQKIFAAAVELSAEERLPFVRASCGDDELLYHEVATLVEEFDTAIDEFETPLNLVMEHVDDVEPQHSVDGYEIFEQLHRGGQGVVYSALQLGTQRRVAIKFMLSGPFASDSARRRFQREVLLVGRLRHPGIVPVFDSGVTAGQPYFVMEYVDGQQLQQYCSQSALDLKEKVALFADICEAVGAAHEQGIVHRDLKPSNVMVTADGEARVLDFGLAKSNAGEEEKLSLTGQVMGTLAYMSPEQAGAMGGEVCPATDVFALCVMLYEQLAGQLPVTLEGNVARKLLTIQACDHHPLYGRVEGVDADIAAIVHKGLSDRPSLRYPDAAALGAELRRYLAGESVTARTHQSGYRLRKLVRKHAMRIGLVSMLLTGVGIGLWAGGLFAAAPPVSGPLAELVDGETYDTADMESQMHAMQDLLRQEAGADELLSEFALRFGPLQMPQFAGLSDEREADLRLLLQTRDLISSDASPARLTAMQQRLSEPGPDFSGMARDVSAGLLEAAVQMRK
ncbi:MAG: serine/threonine protein kinase [Planctomycetaceae bacterium]|nr:serine/threonine protein kinase [Planctomycetaceae bacterium]